MILYLQGQQSGEILSNNYWCISNKTFVFISSSERLILFIFLFLHVRSKSLIYPAEKKLFRPVWTFRLDSGGLCWSSLEIPNYGCEFAGTQLGILDHLELFVVAFLSLPSILVGVKKCAIVIRNEYAKLNMFQKTILGNTLDF